MTQRKRRPRGEGTVYQRKSDGLWVGAVQVRGRRLVVYGKNAKEAADKLRMERTKAQRVPKHRLDVTSWLGTFIDDFERDGHYSGGTASLYRGTVALYIAPAIGKLRLGELSSDDVREMLADIADDGKSTSIRRRVLNVLRAALKEAFMRELVPGNVADRVRAPQIVKGRRKAVSLEVALAFLDAAAGSRYEALLMLLLLNGLRLSESFGLYPEDVDVQAGEIHIRRQLYERKGGLFEDPPKGKKAQTIPLAPLLAEPMRRHLATRKKTPTTQPYLFLSPKGRPLRRSNFYHDVWHPWREEHALPYMVPHQLRHTTGTLLKVAGVPVEIAREILRHASVDTTALVYQDEVPALQREALERLSTLLRRKR